MTSDDLPAVRRLLRRLNPRRHLAAAIGWSVLLLIAGAALIAASVAAGRAEQRVREDTERLLGQFARQVQQQLAAELQSRAAILAATAAQIDADGQRDPAAWQRRLEAVRADLPGYAWLGAADSLGRIVAATDGKDRGRDVAAQPWFREGLAGRYAAQHTARVDGRPDDEVELSVALRDAQGRVDGVLGARLDWHWIRNLQATLLSGLGSDLPVQLWLARADGRLVIGPPGVLGQSLDELGDVGEGGRWLVGRAGAPQPVPASPGSPGSAAYTPSAWQVIVRENAAHALAAGRSTYRDVAIPVLVAGLLAGIAAALVAHGFTRRLERLADATQHLQHDPAAILVAPAGRDEVARIGATLADTVRQLQAERTRLQAVNAALDQRVAQRTARISRMAEEARHAAVSRERLRLARDLHDTLAHSLMALLAQLRLIRKVQHTLSDAALDAELVSAQTVASEGLNDARDAIAQLRDHGVRDGGLGPALHELAARAERHSGLAVTLDLDDTLSPLAGERAEAAFRICEEALRNVQRHARARAVHITLQPAPPAEGEQGCVLCVEDDGIGFDAAQRPPGHYGLAGMAEQATLMEGDLDIDSRPGAGTRLTLRFLA